MSLNTDRNLFQHDNLSFRFDNTLNVDTLSGSAERGYLDVLPPAGRFTDEQYDIIDREFAEGIPTLSYGESFLGMADHTLDMSQLDRQIFEDCYDGSGKVQRQSLNVPTVPRLRRPDYVAWMVNCSLDQAEDLIHFWNILDETARTWPTFISWITKSGNLDKALAYFENLAGELVSDDIDVNEASWDMLDDAENPVLDIDTANELWERVTSVRSTVSDEDLAERLGDWMERRGWETPGAWHYDPGFATPPVFAYSVINNDIGDREDWIAKQPKWFRSLMQRLRTTEDPAHLANMAKRVVHDKRMTKTLGFVFWPQYRAQLAKIEVRARWWVNRLATRVRNAPDSKVRWIGRVLWQMQNGERRTPVVASHRQWAGIWSIYKRRKAAA